MSVARRKVVPPRRRISRPSNPETAAPGADEEVTGRPFPIVGVGASAGGLEALSQMLKALPGDTGMAFVLVQHLDPTHQSMLPEILARSAIMPVVQVKNLMPVEPNHVYVIPPGMNMVLADGKLRLSPRTEARGQNRAVDHFLQSLAEVQRYRAIGVILSGTATDGTVGLEAIKAEGGITFAQDDTAQQTSMPRHAVAAGCVDFVLPPAEISREIARLARHPHLDSERAEALASGQEAQVGEILDLLRSSTEVDFSNYKRPTLLRRISRRQALHKLDSLKDYIQLLRAKPAEVSALHQDVLISVTSFFRNPEAFEALKEKVFPKLLEGRSRHEAVRIWTQGCSTGEEAYSVAMAFAEFAESVNRPLNLQVFATDLNGIGIDKARSGLYDKSIAADVSPERLRRFFTEVDGHYRIAKPIRDKCVFAQHNVLTAPPFSHLDLVSCRNLLIYLDQTAQQRLIPLLHYALRPDGFLWLGSSETIGSFRELFELQDAKHKIYARRTVTSQPASISLGAYRPRQPGHPAGAPPREKVPPPPDAHKEADRLLLARYSPASVLVNADLEVLQFRGDTGRFLAPAPGKATLNLLKMLREGLMVAVRGAIHKAKKDESLVREEGLRVRGNGGFADVNVEVVPILRGKAADTCFLVTFEDAAGGDGAKPAAPRRRNKAEVEAGDRETARLAQELAATREYLQSVIEQQEAANEELQSANEEVQSANEELQSINEELETSKEEIQSSNEELATVNEELHNRNVELSQANNDFLNLLASSQMAIVMLGPDLRIRRFTPHAEKMLNLIAADVGRPISDFKFSVGLPDLEQAVAEVIDSVSVFEREVQDKKGRWYSLRIRPYKTLENKIDGAVLILLDVDSLKQSEQQLRESEARFRTMADNSPVLIWVHDLEGSGFFNRAYLEFLGVEEREVQRYHWLQYVHPDDRVGFEAGYRAALAANSPFEYQARFRRADGEYRWMKSLGMPRFARDLQFAGMAGSATDITDLKEAEEALRQADATKDEYLLMLAHELRSPLGTLRSAAQMIRGSVPASPEQALSLMNRHIHSMARTIDDLIEVTRLSQGLLRLNSAHVDLIDALQRASDSCQAALRERGQRLSLSLPPQAPKVSADPSRLDQVFRIVIGAASQYASPGGQIWVTVQVRSGPAAERVTGARKSVRPEPRHAVIRLRDDGVGDIAPVLPRVLDPFAQHRGVSESPGGTPPVGAAGVGLTVVRRLIELHGGSAEAASSGQGQGTEFTLRLPILETSEVAVAT